MRPRRPGFTLIEMLVAMSVITVALTAVALTLHSLYGVDRRLRDGMAAEANLERLTLALRADVHSAVEAQLAADDSGRESALVLSLPADRSVTYTFRPHGIERLAIREGRESREAYRVDSSAAAWEIAAEKTPARVTLRFPPADISRRTSNLRREIAVVATVGPIRAPAIAAAPSSESQETAPPSTGESP